MTMVFLFRFRTRRGSLLHCFHIVIVPEAEGLPGKHAFSVQRETDQRGAFQKLRGISLPGKRICREAGGQAAETLPYDALSADFMLRCPSYSTGARVVKLEPLGFGPRY